jgi:hypothetical protein
MGSRPSSAACNESSSVVVACFDWWWIAGHWRIGLKWRSGRTDGHHAHPEFDGPRGRQEGRPSTAALTISGASKASDRVIRIERAVLPSHEASGLNLIRMHPVPLLKFRNRRILRSASSAIFALKAASNFWRDFVISRSIDQSRSFHTSANGSKSGVQFRQRKRVRASTTVSCLRIVAIEFSICRSGRTRHIISDARRTSLALAQRLPRNP